MQSNRELVVEGVGLDADALPRPLDFAALYGNSNPVEMEIGTGKGTFLTEQAKARPDVNFLGGRVGQLVLPLRLRPPAPQRLHECPDGAVGRRLLPQ
jgi:hypothetical protein